MIIKSTLHNHSTFCDGKNTIKEMIEGAIKLGFTDIGFSGHSYHPEFFKGWGMTDEAAYKRELLKRKGEYAGRINIYLGLEQDYYGPTATPNDYTYIIGSVHGFLSKDQKRYYAVDYNEAELREGIKEVYNNDPYLMIEDYYRLVVENVKKYKPDVIGHIDLVIKCNGDNKIFDEESPRYKEAALNAVRECVKIGGIFEVNTGGIFRGYKSFPYPNTFLLEEILKLGGKVMINADSHSVDSLDFYFEETLDILRKVGYEKISVFINGIFKEIKI